MGTRRPCLRGIGSQKGDEPASAGLTSLGQSFYGWFSGNAVEIRFSPFTGFHTLHALQPVMRRTTSMVFLLISNILDYPRQPLRSKDDNPVDGLPFEDAAVCNSVVDVVGAGALDLADPLADVKGWRNAHG